MKVDLTENDIKLLNDIKDLLRHVGFGEIYGFIGRVQAIVHHQLLNDDPKCYDLDKDGKKRECKLEQCDKEGAIEIGNIVDALKFMNNKSLLYDRFLTLIKKIENAEKSKGWFDWFGN